MPRPRRSTTNSAARERRTSASDRLSPVTENYLLSLYKMWESSESPTLTQLTEALRQLPPTEGLGTSVPSVAGMLRRMQEQELIDVGADKKIRLTQRGISEGENILSLSKDALCNWQMVRQVHHERMTRTFHRP